jgi:hypothetical protein
MVSADLWPRFARTPRVSLMPGRATVTLKADRRLRRLRSARTALQKQQQGRNEMRKRGMLILMALFGFALSGAPVFAAEPAPAVIDNERVKVFDTTESIAPMPDDFVAISFAEGTAIFGRAGETAGVPGFRTIVIDLKNHPVAPLANNTGYPNAYPRPHIDKLLENDRVIVWHYRWFLNDPTPMHFHDKDVVVVYLENSPLQSTEPDGKAVVNEYKSGDIRFNKRDRTHTELVVRGSASAVITELK